MLLLNGSSEIVLESGLESDESGFRRFRVRCSGDSLLGNEKCGKSSVHRFGLAIVVP